MSTGGSVSEALKFLSQNVCYQSMCNSNGLAYILGQRGVFVVQLMDQLSQLDLFEQRWGIVFGTTLNQQYPLEMKSPPPSSMQSIYIMDASTTKPRKRH